jgi:hypothetical protein
VIDGELVDQRQVLVDGVDAERAGVIDAAQHDLGAVDDDLPGVRPVEPADDLHEGGLAGAVVADQAEHLPLGDVQVDVAQCGERAEPLRHADHPQRVAGHQVPPARRSRDRYWLAIIETRMARPRIR